MLKRTLAYTFIFGLLIPLALATGCGMNSGKKSTAVPPMNGSSMQQALKGHWISEEYADSIDAGLTPKLLEYMIDRAGSIDFDPAHNIALLTGSDAIDTCRVGFDPVGNKVFFTAPGQGSAADTAEFIITATDTLLRLHRDSAIVDFTKYDIGACPGISAYSHLVNSKFIAGKYYALSDAAKEHHIIFTRCGSIEGAEYISRLLKNCSSYEAALTNFVTHPDAIEFYNTQARPGLVYYWEVSEDSLILRSGDRNRDNSIVLVKAQ
jgi:hypothetical protein